MSSVFSEIELGPPIEFFALSKAFSDDPFPEKVNLGNGFYRDNNDKPWVLPVVRKVEKMMADDPTLNHEYLPILGSYQFSNAAVALLLGKDSPAITEKRSFGVQALSGAGALRVGAELLVKQMKRTIFYYSKPTWGNHLLLFLSAGFKEGRTYRYWNPDTWGIEFTGMLEDLRTAPEGAVVVLHACAHNPTGCDPTHEQWEEIARVIQERKLFPFFDCAYQGFASGDLERDSWAVRYFVSKEMELFCAQSFAKNFGLYCERVGNLSVVMKDSTYAAHLASQFTINIRGMYSNPPAHGARIVTRILEDEQLFKEWQECINIMSNRIRDMREALHKELVSLNTPGTWEHIITQIGMFSYTGLTEKQVKYLNEKHHIYMPNIGRISMSGINPGNIKHTAKAMDDAVRNCPG